MIESSQESVMLEKLSSSEDHEKQVAVHDLPALFSPSLATTTTASPTTPGSSSSKHVEAMTGPLVHHVDDECEMMIEVDDTKRLLPNDSKDNMPEMSNRRKIFLICLICFPQFVGAIQFSMIGSFYPQTAKKRGASSLVIGMVVGFLELGVVLAAPFMGIWISTIGIRMMYISGIFAYSLFGFIFGFLEFVDDTTFFFALCMVTRLFMGFATAAFFTATLALSVHFFPKKLASVTGLLKVCGGMGLVIGPLVGGYLYTVGGFFLPFTVTQGILAMFAVSVIWILPKLDEKSSAEAASEQMTQNNLMVLCSLPVLAICATFQVTVNLVLSAADTCLALFLGQFNLTPVQIGLMFLAAPGCYILTTPLWGWISDKKPTSSPFIIMINMSLAAVALFWMGPSPLLTGMTSQLWLVILTLCCYGLTSSATNVAIALMFKTAKEYGLNESTGMISSLVTFCASMGSLSGALVSGLFYDKLHFTWLSTGACFMYLFQVCVFMVIVCVQRSGNKFTPELIMLHSKKC
jgi:MFS family permease